VTETPDSPERIWLDQDAEAGDGQFQRCFENPKYCSEPAIEYVRADLCRADTRPAPPAWQDISTAPKNQYILLGYEQQGDEMPKGLMVGVGVIYDSGKLWIINAEDNEKAWPSSWMPLPAAPGGALSPAPVEGLGLRSDGTIELLQAEIKNLRAALAAYEERRDG
jgi:hypothetical protein